MAVLSAAEHAAVFSALCEFVSRDTEPAGWLKNDLDLLLQDLETWMDGQRAAANTAIRANVRNKATARQKWIALAFITCQQAGLALPQRRPDVTP